MSVFHYAILLFIALLLLPSFITKARKSIWKNRGFTNLFFGSKINKESVILSNNNNNHIVHLSKKYSRLKNQPFDRFCKQACTLDCVVWSSSKLNSYGIMHHGLKVSLPQKYKHIEQFSFNFYAVKNEVGLIAIYSSNTDEFITDFLFIKCGGYNSKEKCFSVVLANESVDETLINEQGKFIETRKQTLEQKKFLKLM